MLKEPVTTVWGFVFLPPTPRFTFRVSSNCTIKDPKGLKKGKTHFPEKTSAQHCMELGQLCEKIACCYITTCLCCHFPVLSLEIPLRKTRILIILLHVDAFKTNQHCKHFVSIWTNYFLTTKVNIEGQYVMEMLLIYAGFVNDTDLLKYHCFIHLFQPDSL